MVMDETRLYTWVPQTTRLPQYKTCVMFLSPGFFCFILEGAMFTTVPPMPVFILFELLGFFLFSINKGIRNESRMNQGSLSATADLLLILTTSVLTLPTLVFASIVYFLNYLFIFKIEV